MGRYLAGIILLLFVTCPKASEVLISLYEHNPWLSVIGSDTPSFIMYEDGMTIFWNDSIKKYQHVRLNNKETKSHLLNLKNLVKLKSDYTLTYWTDQTTVVLKFKLDNKLKRISLYGGLRGENSKTRKNAPKEFLREYDYLINFTRNDARDWQPDYIEVMIWPYEYAPEKSIVWPENWPDIKSKTTKKRGDAYSIFLPFQFSSELNKLLANKNQKGALEINGKKWAIATRLPFPHELSHLKIK